MPEATYVAFVPKMKRDNLRRVLEEGDTGLLKWTEKKGRRGSEFYFSGPPKLARATHSYVVNWVHGALN